MIGVSPDTPQSHDAFRSCFDIPFTLLSDPGKKVARLYDVARRFGMGVSRVTYLIDGEGIIRDVYHHEIRIGRHVENVLKGLEALHGQKQGALQA